MVRRVTGRVLESPGFLWVRTLEVAVECAVAALYEGNPGLRRSLPDRRRLDAHVRAVAGESLSRWGVTGRSPHADAYGFAEDVAAVVRDLLNFSP